MLGTYYTKVISSLDHSFKLSSLLRSKLFRVWSLIVLSILRCSGPSFFVLWPLIVLSILRCSGLIVSGFYCCLGTSPYPCSVHSNFRIFRFDIFPILTVPQYGFKINHWGPYSSLFILGPIQTSINPIIIKKCKSYS